MRAVLGITELHCLGEGDPRIRWRYEHSQGGPGE